MQILLQISVTKSVTERNNPNVIPHMIEKEEEEENYYSNFVQICYIYITKCLKFIIRLSVTICIKICYIT